MKLSLFLKVSRPISWLIAPMIFLAGLFYSGASLDNHSLIQLILLSFPICFFIYGINDIYDYETDKLNPRKKKWEGTKLEKKYHKEIQKYALIILIFLIASSIFTFNTENRIIMTLLIFFSYYYSAPKLRFKEKPPFDSISNGLLVFFIFALGYSFGNSILEIPLKIYLVCLCVSGIHAFSTIADYSADKKAGLKTFSIKFGKTKTIIFTLITFLITLFFSGLTSKILNSYLIFCTIIISLTLFNKKEKFIILMGRIIFYSFILTMLIYLSGIYPT